MGKIKSSNLIASGDIFTKIKEAIDAKSGTLIGHNIRKYDISMLKQIGAFLVNLLKSIVMIAIAVPAAVITLIKTLTTTKKAVNSIPV